MKQVYNKEGYAAFSADGKILRNYWSGGGQTGTNKQSLTDDIRLATIDSKEIIERYINWYNGGHKNKVEFTIKLVKFTETYELEANEW